MFLDRLEDLQRHVNLDSEDIHSKEKLKYLSVRSNVAEFPFLSCSNQIYKFEKLIKKYVFSLDGDLHYLSLALTDTKESILLYKTPDALDLLYSNCEEKIEDRGLREKLYLILRTDCGSEFHIHLDDLIVFSEAWGISLNIKAFKEHKLTSKEKEWFDIALELYYEMFGIASFNLDSYTSKRLQPYWSCEGTTFESHDKALEYIITDTIGLDNYQILSLWNKYRNNQSKISMINKKAIDMISMTPSYYCIIPKE